MASAPSLSFGLNLDAFRVATQADADGLATLQSDGLHIESGLPFFTGYYATNFNSADGLSAIEHIGPAHPQTLTTAELDNIHLVAGEKLVIDYDYIPYDYRYDDFAFSLLKDPGGAIIPVLMGDLDGYLVNNTYPTHFQVTYSIGSTGAFDLMFGSSDSGDTLEPSDLIVHGVSIQAPPGGYTLGSGGVTLADGTVLQANGSEVLPGGAAEPSLLSGASSNLVSTLGADVASNIISQDGNGLIGENSSGIISQDGNGVVSNDGGSVISNDGGSVVSNDGGSVVSNDGGSIISQDGNGIISQDGNGLIGENSSGIINENGSAVIGENSSGLLSGNGGGIVGGNEFHTLSLDEAGGLTRQFTDVAPAPPTGPGVAGAAFIVGPAATTYSYPYTYAENQQVAALSDGKFAVAWVDTQAGGYPEQGIEVLLLNADGTAAAPTVTIPAQTLTVLTDTVGVAALPGGGYAVAYGEYDQSGVPPYGVTPNLDVRLYDASGNAVGDPISVGAPISNLKTVVSASLSDGSFAIMEVQNQGGGGGDQNVVRAVRRVSPAGVAIGSPIVISTSTGAGSVSNDGNAIIGLPGGAFAVAYVDLTASGSNTFGVFYQVGNADGTLNTPVLVAGGAVFPAMAVLTDGNVALAYRVSTSADAQAVQVQIMTPAGVAVGTATTGPYTDIADPIVPTVTALSDGRFLVAYETQNPAQSTTTVVDAQIYNADGTPSGSMIAAGSADTFGPVATQLSNGRVEVVSVQYGLPTPGTQLASVPITLSSPTPAATGQATRQGRAVDGYISGATVFADANGNGVLDAGEATATTDSLGRYSFATPASGPVILTGGTDTSTGLPFTETLTAPAGSLTVTPLTTLVQKIDAANGGNLQLAERQVNAEFGIAAATDVTALDPVRATNAGLADGADAFVDGAIVADTVALAMAAGATGDLYGALAAQVAANPASFDVTSVAAMQALGLSGAVAADTSALAQASKALLTQTQVADASAAQSLLRTGAAIEKVAQGATSQALAAGVASQDLDGVVAAYTGANLADLVAGGGVTATTDTVLGADNIIRSVAFDSAALASFAAPLLAGTAPAATLFIDAAGSYAMSAAGLTAAVDTAAGAVTLVGNDAANETIAAGAGAFAFQGGAGGGTVVGGAGTDSIYLPGGGNWAVNLGGGADSVVAATGNDTIATGTGGSFAFLGAGFSSVASGGADTVLGATGSATVSAAAASDEVFALGGPLDFIAGTGASTVVSGAVVATLFGGAGGTLMFGDGATNYVGGGGTDTVVGLAGSMTAQGGAGGGLYFGGTQGNNVITAGAGNVTAFGGGAGDVLTATGSAADLFAGGVGAETLTGAGSTGTNTFFAGFGPETLIGGAGNTALVAGAGTDLLAGGDGLTLFLFVAGRTVGAADTITGFDPSHDFVKLAGYSGDEATTVAQAQVAGGSAVISLSDGTSVTFAGVTHLDAGSFT